MMILGYSSMFSTSSRPNIFKPSPVLPDTHVSGWYGSPVAQHSVLTLFLALRLCHAGLSYAPPTAPSNGSSNGNGMPPAAAAPDSRTAVTATVTLPTALISMDPISATAAASAAAAAPVAARTLLSMEEEEMTSDQIQCRCAGFEARGGGSVQVEGVFGTLALATLLLWQHLGFAGRTPTVVCWVDRGALESATPFKMQVPDFCQCAWAADLPAGSWRDFCGSFVRSCHTAELHMHSAHELYSSR
jgi:hypothetical protein